ncbi:hypothetical protein EVAR_95874_1 [Eumeta japonica]|uniref:Uncharacterized protein n=1 Tax=Eumeta variegata TaxID=151549 RepID=A0A4C1VLX2_EUMVA|nr:hypothetical protein EVAR_95874_1 [Eumeta japonica]
MQAGPGRQTPPRIYDQSDAVCMVQTRMLISIEIISINPSRFDGNRSKERRFLCVEAARASETTALVVSPSRRRSNRADEART